jgi:ankyrin repeat protein
MPSRVFLALAVLALGLTACGRTHHVPTGAEMDGMQDAIKKGDVEKVRSFLAENPDLATDKNLLMPLCLAAGRDNKAVVELLLANHANVNAKSRISGLTPLDYAAANGRIDN